MSKDKNPDGTITYSTRVNFQRTTLTMAILAIIYGLKAYFRHGHDIVYSLQQAGALLLLFIPILAVCYFAFSFGRRVEVSPAGVNIVRYGRQGRKRRLSVQLRWSEVAKVDPTDGHLTTTDGTVWRIASPSSKRRTDSLWSGKGLDDVWSCIDLHFRHYKTSK